MARKDDDSNAPVDPAARLVTSAEDQAKADKWFRRARELGEKRQFDHAIVYYVNGLEFWPDAVEEALKPLHGCAVARKQTGGKKPGLRDTMTRSMTDKDAKKALINSLWLFGHDPDNFHFVEGVARNASRLRAEDAARWACGVALKSLESNAKASAKQFQPIAKLLEELGDRAAGRNEGALAVEAFQMGVSVLTCWRRRTPRDQSLEKAIKDMSSKLTIQKGQYRDGESFRDSMADEESQMALHDQDRSMQSDERVDQLIDEAEAAYKAAPDQAGTLKRVVDLLRRREREPDEMRAIGLLVGEYKRTNDYRWKQMADDIRIKQLGRQRREAEKAGDETAIKRAQVEQLRFELQVFKERLDRYPTDNRVKFEYGIRCFRAGRFDDAIPLFQAARIDPKNRAACGMYLGRCFYRKGYFTQAIAAFKEAIEKHEYSDDDLAKSMRYWLGRSCEDAGDVKQAREAYGSILQADYNYKDVRDRLDQLPAA